MPKRVVYFLLSYILTVLVGMLLFSGIGSSLPDEISSALLSNFLISIIIMFWLFVGLPAIVAYFVAFRVKRNVGFDEKARLGEERAVEGETVSEKKTVILAAFLTIVGVFVVIFVFSKLAAPRFAPYSLESVEEKDIPRATPVSLSQIAIPDLSNEPVMEKQVVDMSSWKLFEDKLVKIGFNYPEEWGEPQTIFRAGGESGWLYRVYFPASSFIAGGTSADFSEGRGGSFEDFNGFGQKDTGNYFWFDAEELCGDEHILFCREINGAVHVLTGSVCVGRLSTGGYSMFGSFQRLLFLDRPGETISGLVFGGSFLSSSYSSLTQALCSADNDETKAILEKAILERRIDETSAKNLDKIEKVLETIRTLE